MYNTPEISPTVTCSSISGLKRKGIINVWVGNNSVLFLWFVYVSETVDHAKSQDDTEQSSETDRECVDSSFTKKRKMKISDVERRHIEKMQRLDRFNDNFEKLLDIKLFK